jgi:hypothetical protein
MIAYRETTALALVPPFLILSVSTGKVQNQLAKANGKINMRMSVPQTDFNCIITKGVMVYIQVNNVVIM